MTEEFFTPNQSYAAALLKKLISPLGKDPSAEDFKRLTEPKFYEIALAVYSEGRDKVARRNRLYAEVSARSLEPFLSEIEGANPETDLTTLQTSTNWKAFDLADVMSEELPSVGL